MRSSLDTRERLLQVGETPCSLLNGPYETTVREIVKVADVSISAVNYHFGSKDGLLAEVVVRLHEPLLRAQMQRIAQLTQGEHPPSYQEATKAWHERGVEPYAAAVALPGGQDRLRLLGRVLGGPGTVAGENLTGMRGHSGSRLSEP